MMQLTLARLLAYGLFGLPLAMVALPVYVYVPQLYAERFGLSLTLIGSALLFARVFHFDNQKSFSPGLQRQYTFD